MKLKKLTLLSRLLCAFLLVSGLALTSCEDGPLGDGANGGESSVLTWSLDNVTEVSASFTGTLAVPASELSFSKVTVCYSDAETFNINDALNKSTTTFDADQKFSITVTGLNPNVKYNYCLIAEVKSEKTYGDVMDFTTASLVAPSLNAATDVTEVSAVISGTVSPASGTASDLEYGFQYSASSDFSSGVTSKKVTDIDSESRFSVQISSLVPATAYYYRSYIKMNGVYAYGEIKSFTTEPLVAPSLNAATDVTEVSAVISGTVRLASGTASDLEYGFQYSASSDFSSGVTSMKITDIDSENKFSVQLSSLVLATTYYYRSYIRMKGAYGYGEIKSFSTLDPYASVIKDLAFSNATDLSSSASANCYIVSRSGLYKFKTVKGNSTESVGSVSSCTVLWESFGTSTAPVYCELIDGICYKDGYIAFQTADTFKEGNAVIAAKDAAGNILWSWHIWLTDEPQGQVYYNNAGTMMDRNLGATSATPGNVGALGLLYQWGRKDPFLGSSSISSRTVAKSTITWPDAVSSDSSNGTVAYATAHPTTFITSNSKNNDWYYTGSSSTDNTRWTASDKPKSIYDPCPAGWRVPDGGSNGVWSKASGSLSYFNHTYNSTNEGMNFSGKFGSTIWYPASGYRLGGGGSLDYVGRYGFYWSASPGSDRAYNLYFSDYGYVNPSNDSSRALGYSVRCLQESN